VRSMLNEPSKVTTFYYANDIVVSGWSRAKSLMPPSRVCCVYFINVLTYHWCMTFIFLIVL